MFSMGTDEIEALQRLTGAKDEDEEEEHVYGSALNPSSLHRAGDEEKEIAQPNAKIEVKTNTRAIGGGASDDAVAKAREALKKAAPTNQIWDEKEVTAKAELFVDDRAEPEYDIIQKQHLGTEDTFLGMSDRDGSSTHCDCILVKIWLPNTKFAQVQLDIKNGMIQVQSPNFFLNKILPYQVDKEKGKAKFDSDKFVLEVTLPVVNRHILDRLDSDAGYIE